MTITTLTLIEARVLGTLMEKARTVPDSYPLSLNALVLGCNQKTSREPITQISDDEALNALSALKTRSLVFENHNGRTARYEHNFQRAVGVGEPAAVLLGLLMLRGPQTAGELRINAERWYRFADTPAAENCLKALLAEGEERANPLLGRLPRLAGAREQRWVHLLCVPIDLRADAAAVESAGQPAGSAEPGSNELQTLKDRIAALEIGLASLCEQLGVSLPGGDKNVPTAT